MHFNIQGKNTEKHHSCNSVSDDIFPLNVLQYPNVFSIRFSLKAWRLRMDVGVNVGGCILVS